DVVVDGTHDVGDRLEAGVAQVEHDVRAVGEIAVDAPFDGGAIGYSAGSGAVDRHAGAAVAFGLQAADHQVALRQRIDLAIHAAQRGEQQLAAAQALG